MKSSTALVLLPLVVACTTMGTESGNPAPAPAYKAGDRWVYNLEDGFRVRHMWNETREVVGVGNSGITQRVTRQTERGAFSFDEVWAAPGQLIAGAVCDGDPQRFSVPLQLLNFPLTPGAGWSQWVDARDPLARVTGPLNHWVRVDGWDHVTTPAGSFDAIRLRAITLLNDEDTTRWQTNCRYTVWYAPAVGNVVREEREAQYTEKGWPYSTIRTQHGVAELAAYSHGGQ
jgi:hypothetical protein